MTHLIHHPTGELLRVFRTRGYGISTLEGVETLHAQSRAVTISASGDPAQQIVAAAKAVGADLVVVGRRGLSGLNELVLGSVSQKVLHHIAADVLVVA